MYVLPKYGRYLLNYPECYSSFTHASCNYVLLHSDIKVRYDIYLTAIG